MGNLITRNAYSLKSLLQIICIPKIITGKWSLNESKNVLMLNYDSLDGREFNRKSDEFLIKRKGLLRTSNDRLFLSKVN